MKGKIEIRKCPKCGAEYPEGTKYCSSSVHLGHTRPHTLPVYRDREMLRFSSLIVEKLFKGAEGSGVILRDAKGEEYRVYLSDFMRFLMGKKVLDIILRESTEGDVPAWEVITDDTTEVGSSSRWF